MKSLDARALIGSNSFAPTTAHIANIVGSRELGIPSILYNDESCKDTSLLHHMFKDGNIFYLFK